MEGEQMLQKYSAFLNAVEWVVKKVVGIMMMFMVAIMCYQVVLRYAFQNSNIWSEEVTRYLFVYVSLLGSFIAIRRNSHLKVDFFVDLLKGNFKRYFTIITDIAVILFIIYLIPLSFNLCLSTMKNISPGLKMPMGYAYAAIPIGAVFMLLGMIEQLLIKICGKKEETK
ncbi:MAG: TRAP transporter small permease [Firmicutes bacterium]|nr:TRAP transporter small permease [Bacillota bacterium]